MCVIDLFISEMELEAYFVLLLTLFLFWYSFWLSFSLFLVVFLVDYFFFGKTCNYLASADNVTNTPYRFPHFAAPRLTGLPLKIAVFFVENSLLLQRFLRNSNQLNKLDQYFIPDPPTTFPIHFPSETLLRKELVSKDDLQKILKGTLGSQDEGHEEFRFNSIKDYHFCYTSKKKSPMEVGESLIQALEETEKLRAIVEWNTENIRQQAKESTERFNNNTQRALEGIPISVKDQIHVLGYSSSKGRAYCEEAQEDATIIGKLREAGAILFGKANQTEMGIHVTGLNSNKRYGHCRNAYNPDHHTGGSSSGSGSAVAAGLGPVSIAADGGGSIRIPASFCGQVGLKPTCGRVSLVGDTACFGSTVDVLGPVAATAQDAALIMSIISDRDPKDPLSIHSPPLVLKQTATQSTELSNVKIGIYDAWFNDSPPEIVESCRKMVSQLEQAGATVTKICVPELDLMVPAHVLAIASEMYCDVHTDLTINPSSFTAPTRLLFAINQNNSACDYIQSAKVRTRMMAHFERLFKNVDLIITPANGTVAPKIPNLSDKEEESDINKQDAIMRYMHAANLTGYPAIVFPVSYTKENLPIALQCIASPWNEFTAGFVVADCRIIAQMRGKAKTECLF